MKILKLTSILSSLLLACSITCTGKEANAETKQDNNWSLTWSDEFDGNEINPSNWTYDIDGHGWGNNELQYYTNRPENARVEDGNLIIEARKESFEGSQYTSARLKSEGLQNFLYGKVEARIKIPEGQGLWPAFWMLGSNFAPEGHPACGELDIMEHINNEDYVCGTIHWDGGNGMLDAGGQTYGIDFSQYHTYAVEWSPEYIKWFIDEKQYGEYSIKDNVNGTDSYHKPFFIILNLAVGGNWPKNPDATTEFPAKMYVDYVRVYNNTSDSNSNVKARNSWYKDALGNKYYLDGNGNPFTKGWLYTDNWYFLNSDGKAQKGWLNRFGYWFYLDNEGIMKTGWVNDNGNWYYFYSNGEMAHDTTIDGYTLNSDGVWVYW